MARSSHTRYCQSLRVRLTLWYVALLAVILLLFSGVLFLRLNQTFDDNLDDTLHNRAEVVMSTVVDVAALRWHLGRWWGAHGTYAG